MRAPGAMLTIYAWFTFEMCDLWSLCMSCFWYPLWRLPRKKTGWSWSRNRSNDL